MKIRFANRLAVLLCAAIILVNVADAPYVLAGDGEQGQKMSVSGNGALDERLSVSGSDFQGSSDGGDSEADGPVLFAVEAPYTLEGIGISFNHAHQAIVRSPYGSYNCIDFDECAVEECDFVVGGKHVKAADMDIYYPSAASSTWEPVQFNGWQLLGYSIVETSYGGELSDIRQYDPRVYSYDGKTYQLSEADAVISGTLSRDESVWGDDKYHGMDGGCYWFAEDGLLVVSGQFLSQPGMEIATPAYKAGRILYSNSAGLWALSGA